MISYIKGELAYIGIDMIIVETGGIGYQMSVPATVLNQMPPVGSDIKVYTYLYVREDILCLYGFLTRDDMDIFKLLITVNGIGPKGALGILSTITPDDLRFAVLTDDTKTISKAPGIGKKTAQKLVIELKDKMKIHDGTELDDGSQPAIVAALSGNSKNEAVMALVALGYSHAESMKAVKLSGATDDMSADEILKVALKKIMVF